MPNFARLLAAAKKQSTLLVLYIPSADREGKALSKNEQDRWVRKALQVLGKKMGGRLPSPEDWACGAMTTSAAGSCGTNPC